MLRKHSILFILSAITIFALAAPGRAEFRIEKTLKLDPGGRFVLDSDTGSVTVTGSKESGANVVVTSNRDDISDLFNFSFENGAGTARVTARKTFRFAWPHHLSLHFEVRVPTNTRLDIRTGGGGIQTSSLRGDADLRTSGGSVEVSGLSGHLVAHTSGGHISLREVDGDARIETSGGRIEVASLDGSLRAHTSGGPIRIDGVTGRIEASTSGGSMRVTFGRGNTHGGVLETSGGSINVTLDPNASLNIDASTSGGRVTTDLPIKVIGTISGSSLHGTLGSGGESLRLHTSGGSIHIEGR